MSTTTECNLSDLAATVQFGRAAVPSASSSGDEQDYLRYLPENDSLQNCRTLLREEIDHGREYLAKVRRECDEKRMLLEEWQVYEQACDRRPIDHLMESLLIQERVERFLSDWVRRREHKLAGVTQQIGVRERKKNSLATEGSKILCQASIASCHAEAS
jgi:hypothetical protein